MDRDFGRKEEVRAQLNTVSELTAFQRRFLIEFLSQSGPPNATAAYIAAGGTAKHPDRAAYQIRHSPKVIAAIDEYFHKHEMSAREAVALLSSHARGTMADFLSFAGDSPRLDLTVARDRDQLHLVKKFKAKETVYTDKDGGETIDKWTEVELYDAQSALVHIGRYHGLFGPKGDESDPLHTVGMTLDEWRAEQERRRQEAEAQTAETLDIFEDE